MEYHHNQTNSTRNRTTFSTERQPENDINLLLHFDLLSVSVRDPPPESQYFDFGSTSNSPLPSEKPASHPSQRSVKCQYCNEPFPQNGIGEHQEDCYKRKIFCETCAEMIPLEIFDFHSNTCLYNHDNIAFQHQNHYSHDPQEFHSFEDQQPPEINHHQDFWHPEDNVHDSEESHENHEFHDAHDEGNEDEKDDDDNNNDHMFDGYSNMYSYQPVSNTYYQGNNIPYDLPYGYGIENEDLPERYHQPAHEESDSDSEEGGEPIFEQDLRTYEQMMALDNNVVKKGISEAEIKKFPIELYLTEVDGDARCTVCITEYESGETLRRLNCEHRFHKDCIDKWLEHNITCPICKKYLR